MAEKVYKYDAYDEVHNIVLGKTSYRNNNTLAVLMIEVFDDGAEEDWATLTVNIDDSKVFANHESKAFVDINNLQRTIINWLAVNGIAYVTGVIGYSGYCKYPLVEFTKKALDGMRRY